MHYPTHDQVDAAFRRGDRLSLARWYRFLPSPGWPVEDSEEDDDSRWRRMEREVYLMKAIGEHLSLLGGITPQISKTIGWNP